MSFLSDLLVCAGEAALVAMARSAAEQAGVTNIQSKGKDVFGTFKDCDVALKRYNPSTISVEVFSDDAFRITTGSHLEALMGFLVENGEQPFSWGLTPTNRPGFFLLMAKQTVSNSDPVEQIRDALNKLHSKVNSIA